MGMDRRDFLKVCAVAAGKAVIGGCAGKEVRMEERTGLERRVLGRTGCRVSAIGMGGIVVMKAEPEHAKTVVAEVVERGVNYFDVAPTYGDAELKLGPALKPYRERVFLACKTTERTRAGAEREIAASLKRLETDHVDLYQLHAITDVEKDVHAALGKGGAMEAILEARKQGKIRFLGFTAHSPEAAMAAMREFDFDTMMYPVNFATHFRSGFEVEPLAEAKKRKMGVIAIKAMALRKWGKDANKAAYPKCWYEPIGDAEVGKMALYWTMSQEVSVVLPPGDESLFRVALAAGPGWRGLTEAEVARLRSMAEGVEAVFPK